jgi:hypothetical protein
MGCAMQSRCAWCGRDLGRREPQDDDAITHAICPECMQTLLQSVDSTPAQPAAVRPETLPAEQGPDAT